jgi:hypothetical protein
MHLFLYREGILPASARAKRTGLVRILIQKIAEKSFDKVNFFLYCRTKDEKCQESTLASRIPFSGREQKGRMIHWHFLNT